MLDDLTGIIKIKKEIRITRINYEYKIRSACAGDDKMSVSERYGHVACFSGISMLLGMIVSIQSSPLKALMNSIYFVQIFLKVQGGAQ